MGGIKSSSNLVNPRGCRLRAWLRAQQGGVCQMFRQQKTPRGAGDVMDYVNQAGCRYWSKISSGGTAGMCGTGKEQAAIETPI